ncbi:MAG: aminopeptidase P family protein [Thermomicrobiales bacterium]|jgi:Xaa-Pro aminopeptidase|nr:aminopeptidase P family protein [Thermomicrobiales bacterium]
MAEEIWYSGANRRERLLNALERHGLDALLALTPENAHYLAGEGDFIATHWRVPGIFASAVGATGARAIAGREFRRDPLAPSNDVVFFPYTSWLETIDVRDRSDRSIAERIVAARTHRIARPAQFDLDEVFDRVADAVRHVAPRARRLGFDRDLVDSGAIARLQSRLRGVELVEASAIFDDLRAIKDSDEIEHLRRACELAELGMARAIQSLSSGQSELAVNNVYHAAVRQAADENERYAGFREAEGVAAIGLGLDAPGRVAPGQTVKFDMQVDIAGYHSDIGRTVALDPTPDQQTIYNALHHSLEELTAAVQPGRTFAELHAIGSGAMHAAGFTSYSRGHHGHSDGLTQHFEEAPFVAEDEQRPLVPNMVLSVEMPFYVYGVGGFQLERMVLVTESGHELLDTYPFQLALNR